MKLARAAALGSIIVTTAVLGSPALAASDTSQDANSSNMVTLELFTNNVDFTSFHQDFTVRAAGVLRHDYTITDTGEYDQGTFQGKLLPSQVKKLQKLVASPELAAEQGIMIKIKCDNQPVTFWKLTTGDLTVKAPSCNGALPVLPTLAKAANIITSAQFED